MQFQTSDVLQIVVTLLGLGITVGTMQARANSLSKDIARLETELAQLKEGRLHRGTRLGDVETAVGILQYRLDSIERRAPKFKRRAHTATAGVPMPVHPDESDET
jgi:hypothetical protein